MEGRWLQEERLAERFSVGDGNGRGSPWRDMLFRRRQRAGASRDRRRGGAMEGEGCLVATR